VYRVGIDVGGTFTKAVVIDSQKLGLLGKATVPTTYDLTDGVSRGILTSLKRVLETTQIPREEIELLAFSTTHAVNALLEGDVSPVGIVALGPSSEKSNVVKRTKFGDMELSQGRKLRTFHQFVETSGGLDEDEVQRAITTLIRSGAKAIVASEAFGVDCPENEHQVKKIAEELGVPCVAGHEVSGAYGLEIRTITAAINAGILPKMMDVAERLETAVRRLGIEAPIMVMKCDGGLSTMEILKTRPIFTILSGPAASVVGTRLYTRILDGIVIEVGGTTTNLSVVKKGRAEKRYIDVLGYPTTIRSMDVRILPIGGGNLVRAKGRKITDVGPRSARIAGLPYCSYESPDRLKDAQVIRISPREGDPDDYIALEAEGRCAVTLTCASNYLGIPPSGDYARGNPEAVSAAFDALSESLGVDGRDLAEAILEKASRKMEEVIHSLMREYELDPKKTVLVGVGGGASVIVPFTAGRMGLPFQIPEHAEVISSAGTAMAMIREELERNVSEGDEKAVLALMEEAREAAVRRGAMPETISVSTEYIPERRCIRVVAVGSTIETLGPSDKWLEEEGARKIVGNLLKTEAETLELAAETKYYFIFKRSLERRVLFFKKRRDQIVVLDRLGRVHLLLEDGAVIEGDRRSILGDLRFYLDGRRSPVDVIPCVYVVSDSKVIDFSVFTKISQILSTLSDLVKKIEGSKVVVLVGR
jgi:N-methylhydantoinase A/oxoprolinase/acetone carboxylase beta subunit